MSGREGEASTHTLEAFVMLTVMFVAVTSVVQLMETDTLQPTLDTFHTTKARDALAVWNDWPVPAENPCDPRTRLDQLVLEGLEGDHSLWDELIENKFGPAYDVDLVLDTYAGNYPLHGSGSVVGSTAALDWSRDDTYAIPLIARVPLSGTERVTIDSPAVHWGGLARAHGEAVRYAINFTDGITPSQRVAWGLTALHPEDSESAARRNPARVAFRIEGAMKLTHEITSPQLALSGQEAIVVSLVVSAAREGEVIPAGAVVNVSLPAGWSGAWFQETIGTWEDVSPPHSEGEALHLVARNNMDSEPRILRFDAFAPTDGVRYFDVIKAQLSNGSLAESNLVVKYPVPSLDRSTPRTLWPTTPYGMRAGSEHVFGAALANGGTAIDVTDFSIEIPGGYDLARHQGNGAPIFASLVPHPSLGGGFLANPTTGWSVSADHKRVSWKADLPEQRIHVDALNAAEFWVTVQLSSDPEDGTSVQPAAHDGPNVTLSFSNGYSVTSRSWGKSPGVVSFSLPPASRSDDDPLGPTSDGYSWLTNSISRGASREYLAKSRGPMAHVDREGSYELDPGASDAVSFESAIANSSFEVKTRKVAVGERMRVDGDLSSLLAELAHLGLDSTLTLELYSPPSFGCVPTMEWTIDTEHLPTPRILHTMLWEAGLGVPTLFVATEDGYVYRLDSTGAPVWAVKLPAPAHSMRQMDLGLEGTYLLVGTTDATDTKDAAVLALDVIDGATLWTVRLGAHSDALAVYDGANDAVYAASGTSLVQLSPFTGDEQDSAQAGSSVSDLVPTSDRVFVRVEDSVEVRDHQLDLLGRQHADPTGLAAGDALLIVTGQSDVGLYVPDGSARIGIPTTFDASIAATTRARVTADAVEDLVIALADHRVFVIDGATGLQVIAGPPPRDPMNTGIFPIQRNGNDELGLPHVSSCVPSEYPATYATSYTCGRAGAVDELTALAGGEGLAVIGVGSGGAGTVSYHELGGASDGQSMNAVPTALHVGPWLTNERAIAIGYNTGTVEIWDDTYNSVLQSQPSDRNGRFSFYMIVPEGGFFGTHLLVARLSWDDGTDEQEARLVDWFEVVAQDGTPQPRPHYRVALSIAQRDVGSLDVD